MPTYNSFKRITSEAIIDGAVTGTKLGTDSITTAKINTNAVSTADIQNGAVGTTQLAASVDLSGKTVTYRPIVNADIANSTISGGKLGSGTAVNNLGFTPVNRAGGTVASGQLRLAGGSAGNNAVGLSGNDAAGIYFPTTNQVSIATSGSNRLFVDGAGRTNEPNRPAFFACGLGGWYYWNTFGGAGWRELNGIGFSYQTQGGISITSNSRVTAPVSGYYWFYLQTYYYNDNNSTSGYTHWNIGRNGAPNTAVGGRHPHTIFAHGLPNNHAPGIMVPVEFYMNAGDFASPQPYGPNGPGRFHADHTLWCGFLIG
jgi:hypothetical protein